jgi:spermidine synthase
MTNRTDRLVYKNHWDGHLVEIEDSGDYRSLYFGSRSLQSRMSMSRPQDLVLPYTRYMILPILIHSDPRNVLIIGIGSGSFVRFFQHHFPESKIDAVDHSPHVIDVARDYFLLPESSTVSVHCQDGCRFLQENDQKQYDLILIDAFNDQGMAPTVYSDLFFGLCRRCLAHDGIVSCNLWSNDKEQLQELKTIFSNHFNSCLYLPIPDRGNLVALPMPYDIPWSRICLKNKKLKTLSQQYGLNFRQMVKVAKGNNLTITQKMTSLLHRP